jgi:hypothetical protein
VLMQTDSGETCFVEQLVSRTVSAIHATRQGGLVRLFESGD